MRSSLILVCSLGLMTAACGHDGDAHSSDVGAKGGADDATADGAGAKDCTAGETTLEGVFVHPFGAGRYCSRVEFSADGALRQTFTDEFRTDGGGSEIVSDRRGRYEICGDVIKLIDLPESDDPTPTYRFVLRTWPSGTRTLELDELDTGIMREAYSSDPDFLAECPDVGP
jgi:hypothetical protein